MNKVSTVPPKVRILDLHLDGATMIPLDCIYLFLVIDYFFALVTLRREVSTGLNAIDVDEMSVILLFDFHFFDSGLPYNF